MDVDVGMAIREVWWMGGCLFQGTGRCGVWMVNDLNLFAPITKNALALRGCCNNSVAYVTKQRGSEGMEENLRGSQSPFMFNGSVQACMT